MGNDEANLLYVEYDTDGHPHSVITAGENNDRSIFWDFSWSKAFGSSLAHVSGGGGDPVVMSPYCKPVPPHRFWARADVKLGRTVKCGKGWRYVRCLPKHWGPMGYVRIAELLGDPFENVIHVEAIYCRTCDDWLPDEDCNYCEHLAWCDKCEEVVHVLPSGHTGWDTYRERRKRHALREER